MGIKLNEIKRMIAEDWAWEDVAIMMLENL